MDTTFAMMFEAARDVRAADVDLYPGLYQVPDRLDRAVAERKLATMGVAIDELTDRQREYYEDWEHPDSAF
jgi:adenosylhomocysteinase